MTGPWSRSLGHDTQSFLEKLNQHFTGGGFQLPTEAQWEYACRAGTDTATYAGDLKILGDNNAPVLDGIAWYGGNSGVDFDLDEGYDSRSWREKQHPHTKAGTRRVRMKRPNAWGLYDMLGNVWEWCLDGVRTYGDGHPDDPIGPMEKGTERVLRGGSWAVERALRARCIAERVRAVPRERPSIGFRISRGQAAPSGPEGPKEEGAPRMGRRPRGAVPEADEGVGAPNIIMRRTAAPTADWAARTGQDTFGTYAEVVVPPRRRSEPEVVFRMRLIPAGTFQMGSPETERGRLR